MFRKCVVLLVLLGLSVLSSGVQGGFLSSSGGFLLSSVTNSWNFIKHGLLRRPTSKDKFLEYEEDILQSKVREMTETLLQLREEIRDLRRSSQASAGMVRSMRREKGSLERKYRAEAEKTAAEVAKKVAKEVAEMKNRYFSIYMLGLIEILV
jgi:hypothetical protein